MCPDRVVESLKYQPNITDSVFLDCTLERRRPRVFGVAVYTDDSHAWGGEFGPGRSEMFFAFLSIKKKFTEELLDSNGRNSSDYDEKFVNHFTPHLAFERKLYENLARKFPLATGQKTTVILRLIFYHEQTDFIWYLRARNFDLNF